MPLPRKMQLYGESEVPQYAYLIVSGLACMVATTAEGETTAVGLVGSEGLVGEWQLFGPPSGNVICYMQMGGFGYRITLADLQAAMVDTPEIRTRVSEFAAFQFSTLAQLALCQGLHETKQRLARWLLMMQDRTGSDLIEMTQESIAIMVGAQRPTVTLLMGALQEDGYLDVSRGLVRLRNRLGLISAACGCYAFAKSSLDALYRPL